MNSIAFSTLFYIITWNLMLKLSNLYNKYSGNTYALVEIQLNICRNTMDFMCDLEPFSKIRSQFVVASPGNPGHEWPWASPALSIDLWVMCYCNAGTKL